MLGPVAARDEETHARRADDPAMPDAARDDACRPLAQLDDALAAGLVEDEVERAREDVDELVPRRVHLPVIPVALAPEVRDGDEPSALKIGAGIDRRPEVVADRDGLRARSVLQVKVRALDVE